MLTLTTTRRLAWGLALCSGLACAAGSPTGLATDPAAVKQLVDAVSLDVMSEASVDACADAGAAPQAQMRDAWVAWRERHQLPPLRTVLADLMRRQGSSAPSWTTLTEPMRQRVLADPAPDAACAALARDWQGPGMDVTALYPQARAVAAALVQASIASQPSTPPTVAGRPTGQVLLPSQIPALAARHGGGWSVISDEAALRQLGPVYVKGRVTRNADHPGHYYLVQEQGDRQASQEVYLHFDAEAWMGREVVLRGLATSLRDGSLTLSSAALVSDPSGLAPSPLPQAPLARKAVLLQRVSRAPGQGLPEKELAAIVIHGEANYNYGTHWEEDVRFLLRDGTLYRRTEMPPDQLDVAASRRLEPQHWGRWRAAGKGYEMQGQDDDGRPGPWKAEPHHAVRPWPADTRLEGSYSRGSFSGSLITGGTSSNRSIRFTRDGRFERSYRSLSSTGSLQAIQGTVISGSGYGDGKGSSSTGGGTVGTGLGTVTAVSGTRHRDDGASRRGRYRLGGFVLALDYDDGHKERLLSFPVYDDQNTVYVGDGSLTLDK